ncbi:MAG: IS1 family transposase [Methylobacter sp.]|nr:IS1 family transposase [Methylobacter sp.]
MTCYQGIICPKCGGNTIAKSGFSAHGVRRYRCRHPDCPTQTFMRNYRYRAYEPGIKAQVVEMAINSSGNLDTARVLKINKNTVINTLKKVSALVQVNPFYLKDTGRPREVRLEPACQEAELAEQWSVSQTRIGGGTPLTPATNTVLAYVFGKRMDIVFQDVKAMLAPFNSNRYFTDDWGLTNGIWKLAGMRSASATSKR